MVWFGVLFILMDILTRESTSASLSMEYLRGRVSSDQHIWICDENCAYIIVFIQSLPAK
ncbi:hypothetical protein MKW92_028717, partial [Papaver armeniacum]